MPMDKSRFTHDAYIFKRTGMRKGRPSGYWQAEGVSRIEPDGSIFTVLHSTPIGGFDGRIVSKAFHQAPPCGESGGIARTETEDDDDEETEDEKTPRQH